MKNEKVIYNGRNNPYRKGSEDYYEYIQQRDWWMNNLNLTIITDYLTHLDFRVSSLEFRNEILLENLKEKNEHKQK